MDKIKGIKKIHVEWANEIWEVVRIDFAAQTVCLYRPHHGCEVALKDVRISYSQICQLFEPETKPSGILKALERANDLSYEVEVVNDRTK